MSILADAFQHALNARERVVGVRETVRVGGQEVDALVEVPVTAPEPIPGGMANPTTFLCQVDMTAFSTPPTIGTDVIVREQRLKLLELQNINQVVYGLFVGDASYE